MNALKGTGDDQQFKHDVDMVLSPPNPMAMLIIDFFPISTLRRFINAQRSAAMERVDQIVKTLIAERVKDPERANKADVSYFELF